MEAHTKTAEQIKAYIDRLDLKTQELNQDITTFIDKSKIKYHREIEDLKKKTKEAKEDTRQKYHQRLQEVKKTYYRLASEGKILMETKLEPAKTKINTLKREAAKSAHDTEEKWGHLKDEAEELLETIKLAFHNFSETFKDKK